MKLKIPPAFVPLLRCPGKPHLPLRVEDGFLSADDREYGVVKRFPVVNGTPILINEDNSVFRIADFEDGAITTMDLRQPNARPDTSLRRKLLAAIARTVPNRSVSVTDFSPQDALTSITRKFPSPKILVLGAGDARFHLSCNCDIIYSDVALADDTNIIADAHDVPFCDDTFDAVFAVAVLEHVADPNRCVEEVRRVLKLGGYIYAVAPFMQQVHMGAYDFTRYTAIGLRRLLRWFDEEKSGVANGPGTAVAWSLEYFISSFSENPSRRKLLRAGSRFLGWPFLFADRLIVHKRGVVDCFSAYYFFGPLRDSPISDREVVSMYNGLNGRKPQA